MKANAACALALSQRESCGELLRQLRRLVSEVRGGLEQETAIFQAGSWSNGIHLARGDRELEERLAKTNHLHVELYPELIGSTDTTALANHFTSFVRYLCMLQRREKCFCDLVINRGRNLE
jgi:hypothetical protein